MNKSSIYFSFFFLMGLNLVACSGGSSPSEQAQREETDSNSTLVAPVQKSYSYCAHEQLLVSLPIMQRSLYCLRKICGDNQGTFDEKSKECVLPKLTFIGNISGKPYDMKKADQLWITMTTFAKDPEVYADPEAYATIWDNNFPDKVIIEPAFERMGMPSGSKLMEDLKDFSPTFPQTRSQFTYLPWNKSIYLEEKRVWLQLGDTLPIRNLFMFNPTLHLLQNPANGILSKADSGPGYNFLIEP
ncbi:MAG: hypothetical protein WCG27_11270, partial [Pseudomonadota bacterium]